jgi:hypothetical protein
MQGDNMSKVDIFGDGKHIFDTDNLPTEFVNIDGKYRLSKGSVGFSYNLVEPSASYLSFMNEINKREEERKAKIKEESEVITKLISRVEALEKK